MTIWKKQVVLDALKEKGYLADVSDLPGGDWDLLNIWVQHPKRNTENDDAIHIVPFTDPQGPCVENPDKDQEIVAVQVSSRCGDSRGGCNSEDEVIQRMYCEIKIILRKFGYQIIDHYDEIF